jgi:hypothetical protein
VGWQEVNISACDITEEFRGARQACCYLLPFSFFSCTEGLRCWSTNQNPSCPLPPSDLPCSPLFFFIFHATLSLARTMRSSVLSFPAVSLLSKPCPLLITYIEYPAGFPICGSFPFIFLFLSLPASHENPCSEARVGETY